jgi:3'-phosphoadenosine 5'-phosphosulfate sulfotransferase (PAPS reductase)/FAD synthetase
LRYVSLSGGADSTALAIYLHERGENFELVFCDTGAELPETYWILPRIAKTLDKRLIVLAGKTFFQQVATYGYLLPDSLRRWCTKDLKQTPLREFAKHHPDALLSVGIRADESHRFEPSPTRNTGYEFDRPLVDAGFDKRDVRKLCERYDLLNSCYTWRSSCSCFCCPFQRKADWLGMLNEHPSLYAVAESWEDMSIERSGHKWCDSFSLKHRRTADEAQLRLLPDTREVACAICSW